MRICPESRCRKANRPEARFCARCGSQLLSAPTPPLPTPAQYAAPGNPVLSASWFFFAALLGMGGIFFLLTGGPILLGLGLIVFSCTALSPREERGCR